MCGTPNYISPEVATRSSHGLEADVWGLGCMLYTLLVGNPPFDTDAVKSTLTRVVMADYKVFFQILPPSYFIYIEGVLRINSVVSLQVPVHLSLEAQDLIDNLLKKNPRDRIKLQDILKHPFLMKSKQNLMEKVSSLFLKSTFYRMSLMLNIVF